MTISKLSLTLGKPARTKALSTEKDWYAELKKAGFRLEPPDGILPPCEATEYPGVCVEFRQWDDADG